MECPRRRTVYRDPRLVSNVIVYSTACTTKQAEELEPTLPDSLSGWLRETCPETGSSGVKPVSELCRGFQLPLFRFTRTTVATLRYNSSPLQLAHAHAYTCVCAVQCTYDIPFDAI